MRLVIPAAGFGTRMNMAPNQSKELLLGVDGFPLIFSAISAGQRAEIPVTVVTRAEKLDLIDYIAGNAEIVITKESESWLDSVAYATSFYKNDQCVVVLPDTVCDNLDRFLYILKSMRIMGPCAGTLEVTDFQNWGMIRQDGTIVDKPTIDPGTREAWGVLVGTHEYFKLLRQGGAPAVWFKYPLENFRDVTRSIVNYQEYCKEGEQKNKVDIDIEDIVE